MKTFLHTSLCGPRGQISVFIENLKLQQSKFNSHVKVDANKYRLVELTQSWNDVGALTSWKTRKQVNSISEEKNKEFHVDLSFADSLFVDDKVSIELVKIRIRA